MPLPDTTAAAPAATLDRRAIVRHFARAAARYDAHADALGEVRTELLSRVEYFGLEPRVVLDIGAGTGQCAHALRRRFRNARVLAIDLVPAMLDAGARRARWPRRYTRIAGDACALPLRDSSCELIVANLSLEWCGDLDLALAELRRVLAPPGVFLFSTLGAGTLRELRESWLTADRSAHVHDFVDMHDLGSALARAGFAEPVLDVEDYTHGFESLKALGATLRALGAGNAHGARARTHEPPPTRCGVGRVRGTAPRHDAAGDFHGRLRRRLCGHHAGPRWAQER